jgi:CRISPR-associated protein Cmr6
MPIAAVPTYLRGQDFSGASPGMRFGMYLTLWGVNRRSQALLWTTHDIGYEVRGQQRQEREVRYENKVSALTDARRLNRNDKASMNALHERQVLGFKTSVPADAGLCLDALAVAPFTTGLGNEHPLENGFAFLNPYGLPYLPGSGVKGVLRQAARELASGDWGDTRGWSEDPRYPLLRDGKPVVDSKRQPVVLSMLDVLFGRETPAGESEHVRGALTFWDVIPQIAGGSLAVEIMTPHQTHYYQKGDVPHESGQPNPISFLTVPPGSRFVFHVQCDRMLLGRLAPDLVAAARWKALLDAAFRHAFEWLGFGAKTAVGYGQMKPDEPGTTSGSGATGGTGPDPDPVAVPWPEVLLKRHPGSGDLTVTHEGKTARASGKEAEPLLAALGPELQGRLKRKKELRLAAVEVKALGNAWRIVRLVPVSAP